MPRVLNSAEMKAKAWRLYCVEGLSFSGIARRLGITINRAMGIIHRHPEYPQNKRGLIKSKSGAPVQPRRVARGVSTLPPLPSLS